MGAIRNLYNGRIGPPTYICSEDNEYSRLLNEAEKLETTLTERLSDDEMQTVIKLLDTQRGLSSIVAADNYAQGFRDGGSIMLDMLTGKNDTLI